MRRILDIARTPRTFVLLLLLAGGEIFAGDDEVSRDELAQYILGEWKMETRILTSPRRVTYQQVPSIFITEQRPDGTFRVITSYTVRAVAEIEGDHSRPECVGKKECFYDTASEGIGRLINNKFFIDWIDEGWIDDVLTISGNKMSGDDGNGPINLTKVE